MYSALSNDRHECGPCSLCNRTSTRYFHTDSWDSDKYTHFTNNVLPPALTAKKHMCICRACHHDIDSNISNEKYIPRWKKLKSSKPTEFTPCSIQGCTSNADVTTIAINLDNIPEGMELTGQSSKFCSAHYHYVYNYQHQIKCKICGIKAKVGEMYRCCPNPPLIEKYLRATISFNSTITDTDKICHICYTKYTEVINIYKTFIKIEIHEDKEELISLDADLDIVIANLKQKSQSLEEGTEMSSLNATKIMVAETIRNQKAIMLPAVTAYFKSGMTAEVCTRTTRWLLRQLEEAIGHHLKSACKHRKYGTILYRAGGDLLHALSSALGSTCKCTSTDDQSIILCSNQMIKFH